MTRQETRNLPGKKVRVTVTIPAEMRERLSVFAEEFGVSVSRFASEIVEDFDRRTRKGES